MTERFGSSLAVIGTGRTGITMGAGLASLGHSVLESDISTAELRRGISDEPGLSDLLSACVSDGRLRFTDDLARAVAGADVVFLCGPDREVEHFVADLRRWLSPGSVIVNSCVPPLDSTALVADLISRDDVVVVSNPQDIREGTAVEDFLAPPRIVIGSDVDDARERVAALYSDVDAPVVRSDVPSADLVMHASNGYVAVKQCFVNSLAELCAAVGADINCVSECLRYDTRIGPSHLLPAPIWNEPGLRRSMQRLLHSAGRESDAPVLLRAAADGGGEVGSGVRAAGTTAGRQR